MDAKLKRIVISKAMTILECYRLLDATGYRVLVCEEKNRLYGIVMDSDIRRAILSGMRLEDKIAGVVNKHPIVAKIDMPKAAVLSLMKEKKVDPIPIVDCKGRFVDLYSMNDLVKSSALTNCAVIMAGGSGKRLMPLTQKVPKPLLNVRGKTILEHIIDQLSIYGINKFFVSINYKSEQIKKILGDGSRFGVTICYLEEKKQLGTVGAVSLLKDHAIQEHFIVMNADVLAQVNFQRLLEEHAQRDGLLTVCLTNHQYNVPFGVMEVEDNRIVGLSEKPSYNFFINAGIYCMSPDIIEFIPQNAFYDMTTLIHDLLEKKIPIHHFVVDEYWRDVGSFEDFYTAKNDVANGKFTTAYYHGDKSK